MYLFSGCLRNTTRYCFFSCTIEEVDKRSEIERKENPGVCVARDERNDDEASLHSEDEFLSSFIVS